MKNIWILNHYAVPHGMGGGTRHYDLAYELVKRGYKVTIFSSSYNHFNKKEILNNYEKLKEEDISGVKFVWIRTKPHYEGNGLKRLLNMISYLISMMRIYKQFEKPDTVIGSSVHLFAPVAAYLIGKKVNARFICEIRDLWPQTLVDMGAISAAHPLAIFFRLIEGFIYKKAHKIIALLPGAFQYITRFNVSKDKIVYIPNGVDIHKFDINREHAGQKPGILSKEFFNCTYAGAHGEANKLDNILDAARIIQNAGLDEIRFNLIGDGPEKNNLKAYSNELGLKNVNFFDQIDKKYIPGILGNSDLLMFNLKNVDVFKYGISSNKLFDYLCASKPVIFACKCYNNIIEEAQAGVSVEPENPEALTDAIISVFRMNQEERMLMGKNGREYVEKYHSIEYLANQLEKCFY